MNLLKRIFGRRPDPTIEWRAFIPPIPDFDLSAMQFGSLRFGDTFSAASFLGRPDKFEWTQGEYCQLLYASGGFQIDFDGGKFAYLAFFIGPDRHLPKHKALEFSKPRLRGCMPDGVSLSRANDRPQIERLFGSPVTADNDATETILFYRRRQITMEFEFDGQSGPLKRWNLYPHDTP